MFYIVINVVANLEIQTLVALSFHRVVRRRSSSAFQIEFHAEKSFSGASATLYLFSPGVSIL